MGLKAEIDEAIEISVLLVDDDPVLKRDARQINQTLKDSKEFLDKTKEVLAKILTNKVDRFEIEKLLMEIG